MRTQEDRMRLVAIILVGATAAVILMLFYSMILGHGNAEMEVHQQVHGKYAVWDAPWGVIKDRKGELLAGLLPRYFVDANISWITDTARVAREMAPYLPDLDEQELYDLLTLEIDNANKPQAFSVRLDFDMTYEEYRTLHSAAYNERYGIVGEGEPQPDKRWLWPELSFWQTWIRDYPEDDMLGQTLGYVNVDGDGVGGVEAKYQYDLRPEGAWSTGDLTLWNYPFPETMLNARDTSSPGGDVYLTVDRTIQAYIEDELDRTLAQYNSESGTVIVMEVKTGNILAIASRPTYHPGYYQDYKVRSEEYLFHDPAVSAVYEPGSVFKPVTVAAAYNSNSIPDGWVYYDNGHIYIDDTEVPNALRLAYGTQDVQGILDNSLNVGVATIATQLMDKETFYEYITRFGFGYPTNVGLANEQSGIVHLPNEDGGIHYEELRRANNAFGQSISVTPLQMINAINVIADGGWLMEPHIVSKIVRADESVDYNYPQKLHEEPVISEDVAVKMQLMLEHVVTTSVNQAEVPGYRVAGKTGTAQIPIPGGYDPNRVITSFIGFGPLPDPEVIILVKIDDPKIAEAWGITTAAPAFSTIAQRVFTLMGIPPTETGETVNAATDGL